MALTALTVVLSFLAHSVLKSTETDLAHTQYESIADRALTEAAGVVRRTRWSLVTLASVIGTAHPDTGAWPFVRVLRYETITGNLLNSSAGEGMSFFPLLDPNIVNVTEWENYAYEYYETDRDPPFPNGTAISGFGRGIFGVDRSLLDTYTGWALPRYDGGGHVGESHSSSGSHLSLR